MAGRRPAAPAVAPPAPAAVPFSRLLGHERPLGFLRRAFEAGRLAHAYVFTGPAGVGKLAAARALAMGLHCEVAPFDGCGDCNACRTIVAGSHPDVRFVLGPVDDKRDVSIEQVRGLQRELGFRSMSRHPKVGVLNDAHLLTLQAQNALLKTLEEPPGASVLILVAVNAAALAPTILSRCQRVAFGPLPADAVAAILERHGRAPAEAAALAAYADGSPGKALELDAEFFGRRRGEILRRLTALRGAPFHEVAAFAQELAGGATELGSVLTVIASWYRDTLRRQILGPDAVLQNADLADTLAGAGVHRDLRNLEATYATIAALRQNANRNLALVQMLLRITD